MRYAAVQYIVSWDGVYYLRVSYVDILIIN